MSTRKKVLLVTVEDMLQWYGDDVAQFNMTFADASSMAHAGTCDDDVAAGMRIPYIVEQFAAIDAESIRNQLDKYAAWDDEELADDDANQQRLLWLIACDIREDPLAFRRRKYRQHLQR